MNLPTGTVTFLFTDIEGSTRLWEQHPEAMRPALARHHALVTTGIERHGGVVIKSQGEGDSVFAVFASATDAVAAAAALQQSLLAEPWPDATPLRVRAALHTGEAELREGDYYGPTVNRCARLRAAAHGGQILLSQATHDRIHESLPAGATLRDLGERRLKDLTLPERIYQLLHPALPQEFPPLNTLDLRPNNLPAQTTPLVGREDEGAAARDLIRRKDVRLVTLTGPGGTGKTRLALQLGADLIDDFEHGVFFVDLAPVTDPGLVSSAIAQTLGVSETGGTPLLDSLKESLRDQQTLLILDNFEHVLEAAPLVAGLLAAASWLKVLVTSRAVLRLRGEHEFPVPPLGLPDLKRRPSAETLSRCAAVELFIQRAIAVRTDFTLTEENASAVAEICHRLDGLPLAIELAAARVKLLPPQALLSRLENRLKLLTGGARDLPARQQTLRSTIAWSYELLDREEQKLFRRLSVFLGGCTLEAVAAVCDPMAELEIDILDGITALVNNSLMRQEETPGSEPRFRMLETLREYGLERLKETEEESAVRRRHADYFRVVAEQIKPLRTGEDQGLSIGQRELDLDNMRAALDWFRENREAEAGLRLWFALDWFWNYRGHYTEGHDRAVEFLSLPEAARRTTERANVLWGAGRLAFGLASYGQARALHEEGLSIYRELGHDLGIARSLHMLASVVSLEKGDEAARPLLEESLEMQRRLGNKGGIIACVHNLGNTAFTRGDYEAARALYEEALEMSQAMGEGERIAFMLGSLANLAHAQGDYERAQELCEKGLGMHAEMGHGQAAARLLTTMGKLAYSQQNYREAWARYGSVLEHLRERGRRFGIVTLLNLMGELALAENDLDRADKLYRESLALAQALSERWSPGQSFTGFAAIALRKKQPERAARLLSVAEAMREILGVRLPPVGRTEFERQVAAARAALDSEAFSAAWEEGRAMLLEQAAAYALEEISPGAME